MSRPIKQRSRRTRTDGSHEVCRARRGSPPITLPFYEKLHAPRLDVAAWEPMAGS
jgi:hypothetical protein